MKQAKMMIVRDNTLSGFPEREKRHHSWPAASLSLGLFLVLAAASFWILWIYCFNSQSNPAERLAMFKSYFPVFLSAGRGLSFLSIGLCTSGIALASLCWNDKCNALKSLSILTICSATIILSLTLFSLM